MLGVEQWFDDLPLWVKVVFALPLLDGFTWGVYRISRGRYISGLIWFLIGGLILWPIDLVTLIFFGRIRWLI